MLSCEGQHCGEGDGGGCGGGDGGGDLLVGMVLYYTIWQYALMSSFFNAHYTVATYSNRMNIASFSHLKTVES